VVSATSSEGFSRYGQGERVRPHNKVEMSNEFFVYITYSNLIFYRTKVETAIRQSSIFDC